jgi:hypothetical protein
LFEVDYHGNDVMYLLPTDKAAMAFSKTRFSPAIKLSPYLANRFEDFMEFKIAGTATLYIRGALGDINVKSTPVSRLVIDELDVMDERQIWLALERLSGHSDKIVWGMSTPTYPNVGIHKLYLKSTQEHFFFPCPHCYREIELTWPDSFALRGESVDDPKCHDSFLKCHLCHDMLPHEHKRIWLAPARWKATAHDADPDTRGFSLNQLYSPGVTPGEIAVAYHRGCGDEAARREFHNSKLGLPYIEDGTQVSDTHIDACLRDYSLSSTKIKVGDQSLITLGVDQGDFHHWVAVKWELTDGKGDLSDRATGKVIGLGKVFRDDWDELKQLMRAYQVKMCVIDHNPQPTPARWFARQLAGYVWMCLYITGVSAREIITHEDDFGANVVKVNNTAWLSKTLGRVMGEGIQFPRDIPLEFRHHLKNLVRTYKKGNDGNYHAEYVNIEADHYAHALNYAEIALKILERASVSSNTISNIR